LFKPETALRVRWDNWQETPLSAETPAGQNPPDGAIIDYYLKASSSKEITLEIRDEHGNSVQHFSSKPNAHNNAPGNVPDFWFAPPELLPDKAGMNRFVWNIRFPHPSTLPYSFYGRHLDYIEYTMPDYAIPGETPRDQPQGPLAAPGNYEVLLTIEGKTYRQPLVVKLDPRVNVPQADLEAQINLAKNISDMMKTTYNAYNDVASLRAALVERLKSLAGNSQAKDATDTATSLVKELDEIEEGTNAAPGFGSVNRNLARVMTMIESGDLRPAQSLRDVAVESCESLKNDLPRWRKVNAENLSSLNKLLNQYKLAPLPVVTPAADPVCSK
jgi:hypothetical protein